MLRKFIRAIFNFLSYSKTEQHLFDQRTKNQDFRQF